MAGDAAYPVVRHNPRERVCVSSSPFERGHPATPRRRLRPGAPAAHVSAADRGCVALTRNPGRCKSETARLPRFSAAFGETSPKPDLSPSRCAAQAALRDLDGAARPLALADSVPPLPDSASAPLHPCTPPFLSQLRSSFARAAPESACSTLKRRGAFGRSLSLHRSRIPSQRSRALWAASV